MLLIHKLFHRSGAAVIPPQSHARHSTETPSSAPPPYSATDDTKLPVLSKETHDSSTPADPISQHQHQHQPQQYSPQPLVHLPSPAPSNPSTGTRSAFQITGVVAGAGIAVETGGGAVMGMVDGLVVGSILSQRIQQHKKTEYWRNQAANYHAGSPAAGVGDSRVVSPVLEGRNRQRATDGRDERRRKRWERRSKRGQTGAGMGVGEGEGGSSGSEGEALGIEDKGKDLR